MRSRGCSEKPITGAVRLIRNTIPSLWIFTLSNLKARYCKPRGIPQICSPKRLL